MSSLATARQHMIDSQLRPNEVNDEQIIDAITSVNREKFIPKTLSGVAYNDDNIQLNQNRSMMGPMVFARLVDAAKIKADDLVLDIGCATGYSSAVLANLAEAVVALEEDTELADNATKILADEECDNVAVVKGALVDGLAAQGPYDLIFINGMIDHIPDTIIDQIADGGRLICVLNDNGIGKATYVISDNGVVGKRTLFDATIPALHAFDIKKTFSF